MKKSGIVLVSGGMDSLVTAAMAAGECDELRFLHASYGQRTATRERDSFRLLAAHYDVSDTLEVSLNALAVIGGNSLTDLSIPVSEFDPASHVVPTSYVPFRNAHLLATAVSWAEGTGANRIYIGAVEEDSSGYPDCRRVFYDAFQRAIDLGTRDETHIEIITPVIDMRKADIVRQGIELGAPFELSWSCYRCEDVACGTCDSCALRLRAFREAGYTDPISYAEGSR
ncbi:MAG: 7-cyano-7-deazaguanine synthase QueC [Candidatus Cloacimonetes bacterium]|nr:7-cyano-7-deazaguanine synthase QueC [Candidatus Cloacimonadota bacterium]